MTIAVGPWSDTNLGELGETLIGLTYSPTEVDDSGVLVLRSSNIQDGRLALDDTVRVQAKIPDAIRVRRSDILICVRNGSRALIGKSLYLDERVEGETFGAFMAVFRSPHNEYLRFWFQSDLFKRQVGEHLGATINQITNKSIKGFVVSVPSTREQLAIAQQLADADGLIEALVLLIAKKRAIKLGIMQELLTGSCRLPGFVAQWRDTRLGELGVFLKGRGIRRDQVRPAGVPCIRYGELYTAFSNYTDSPRSFVDPSIAVTALPICDGDVLFAGSGETKGEIGMSIAYIGEEEAVAGGDIIVLRGANYDPVFLASLLNSPSVVAQKARGGQGDAVVHISLNVLAAIQLRVPEMTEQQAIASVIRDFDAEISALERRLDAARNVKQGMMQELLTGRTRLGVEKDAA